MILPARKRAAAVAINRYGQEGSIKAPSTAGTNEYGKADNESWSTVTSEKIVITYGSGEPDQARYTGGRFRTESPILFFRRDSPIREGYRVAFSSGPAPREFEVDSFAVYPSHIEAETTLVS